MPTGTPDTLGYMLLGYAIMLVFVIGLTVFLVLKRRSLLAEIAQLEALEAEEVKPKRKIKPAEEIPLAAVAEKSDIQTALK